VGNEQDPTAGQITPPAVRRKKREGSQQDWVKAAKRPVFVQERGENRQMGQEEDENERQKMGGT